MRGAAQAKAHPWRQGAFILGVVAISAVLQTHFDYMAQHQFFLNRVQHIVMHHLGPFLIAVSWPGESLRRGMPAPLRRLTELRSLRRAIAVIQQPALAGFLFVGLIYLFLIPAVHFRAMIDSRLYPVPPHGSATFEPGGYHLMCMTPSAAATPGHSFPVTLHSTTVRVFRRNSRRAGQPGNSLWQLPKRSA